MLLSCRKLQAIRCKKTLPFFHDFLAKGASLLYFDKVKLFTDLYGKAVALVKKEYNSVVRRTRLNDCLTVLRLYHYNNSLAHIAGTFSTAYKCRLNFTRQDLVSHCGDDQKTELLRDVVSG